MDEVSRDHVPRVGGTPTRRHAGELALLPTESPLPMPRQPLHPETTGNVVRDRLTAPRAILLFLTISATATFVFVLYQVLSVVHLTPLQAVFLVLCTLCFAWIALGTASALLGFLASLRSGAWTTSRSPIHEPPEPRRTALLFPVYQEDAARVAATIEAIASELIALGDGAGFDFFILSDSRTPEAKAGELRAVHLLRRALPGDVHVYYRARSENIGKKAGNIADWVERFGGGQ